MLDSFLKSRSSKINASSFFFFPHETIKGVGLLVGSLFNFSEFYQGKIVIYLYIAFAVKIPDIFFWRGGG
jgi:hypothetical protein